MDEILWIRSADYDPAVKVGTQIQPEVTLPVFEVKDRRPVVMLFKDGETWEIKPFTQLTLREAAAVPAESTEPESFVLVGPS
ncbi:hypothetical protein ACRAWG_07090 [Methylobacterium sp. P31]